MRRFHLLFLTILISFFRLSAIEPEIHFPEISSIENLNLIQSKAADYLYDACFDVYYEGAERINVRIEEEDNPKIRLQTFTGEKYCQATVANLTKGYYASLEISVKNEAGTVKRNIEIKAEDTYNVKDNLNSVDDIISSTTIIDIYNLQGIRLVTAADEEFIATLNAGIYIIVYRDENRIIHTEKRQVK